MTKVEHDGAQFLTVKHFAPSGGSLARGKNGLGWYVVRVCPCHQGEVISNRMESQKAAERLIRVLDDDARLREKLDKTQHLAA